ncbi:MAG: YqhA family protein [Bacteroidaceae bacterium]|nr:YqhA family protein [Bacteroidaceae bacterium]
MTLDLRQIKNQIVAKSSCTPEDVINIEEALYDEEGINAEKGALLFELKNSIRNLGSIPPQFANLFVEAICKLLLEDEESPSEIDDSEAKWLRAQIKRDGFVDDLETRLLEELRLRSMNFPAILVTKNKMELFIEKWLYRTKYLAVIAVIGSLISALALFIKSSMVVYTGLVVFFNDKEGKIQDLTQIFVESIDTYLFALVLIIFGIGVYELFISKVDPTEQNLASRPSWLRVNNIDSLKSSLGSVILMVLIVSVFEYSLKAEFSTAKDILYLAIGVVLVALSLYLTHLSHKTEKGEEK